MLTSITEQKKYVMIMMKTKILFIALGALAVLIASALPAYALDYSPGVAVGDYVRYGNFAGSGPGFEAFNSYSWQKIQITNVAGKEVTLLFTGQLTDGSPTPGNGSTSVWNLEAGTENGIPSTQGPIISADLNQNDPIPPQETYTINSTQTRIYLGAARTVNILNLILSTPDYNTTITLIYDKLSGILLEASSETTQDQAQPTTSKYSYSVTETNVFGTPTPAPTDSAAPSQTASNTPTAQPTQTPWTSPSPTPQQPQNPGIPAEYLAVAAIIAVVLIAAAIALLKKTKK